ncbi:hypothetical protein H7I53_14555 [Mycolicibacterium pulveris]|uniref:ARB-07466-like C-terminal domain-containing protein n=1 Tax=Mycolicibacterium pulveris TaxID=36813 RepID=A0A7I7UKU3_MYCPV|nr:hypothetical protein [Mycolicibacterium pulveris]MCV6981443.1 hypothetical protein [Mycolicibacterium pulveris]BBY82098.1 hypothetical protein MPUL_32560 [Mycolicibacterium pulveris]
MADRAAGIPGLWGLVGSLNSSNPTENLANWGNNTIDWLGNFAAGAVTRLGTSLWKGALGLVGLENSILSPDNEWFQAAAKSAGFFLGNDGPFATLLGQPGDATSATKAATPKQLREGQDRITDKDNAVAVALARLNELPADAKESQRLSAQNALDKARREAEQARTDYAALTSGGAATTGSTGQLSYEMLPSIGSRGSERGLQVNTLTTARAIAATFPQIREIGGYRQDPLKWHPNGLAIDVMIPNWDTPQGKALGDQIYSFVMGHADTLGIDRSATLWQVKDHFNHLHIATTGGGYPATHDIGGRVPPGLSVVSNQTGGDEYILNRPQAMEAAAALEARRILPTPPPRPGGFQQVPDAHLKQIPGGERIAPSGPAEPAPAPGAPSEPTPTIPHGPAPGAGPAPSIAIQPTVAPPPGGGGGGGNNNHPALNQAISSGAATLGNLASTAASFGLGGGPLGGAAGSLISGLFQQGGKIAQGVANVASSFLIGNVTGGTTPEAYGRTLRSRQNVPVTAADRGGNKSYIFNGISDIGRLT